MSVLACDRYGCRNVMCDRLSDTYGYICDECFEELVYLGYQHSVEDFMCSPKKEHCNEDISYDVFNKVFPYSL